MTTRCPHCSAAVTASDHPRPILLDADGGPHVATCPKKVLVADVGVRRKGRGLDALLPPVEPKR